MDGTLCRCILQTIDASTQDSERANGLPNEERFNMQVQTPFPALHVEGSTMELRVRHGR